MLITFSLVMSACAFAQAPDSRFIFESGLAGTLLNADTAPASVTEARGIEG